MFGSMGNTPVIETTVYARLAPSSMYDGNEHINEPRTETKRRRARMRVLSPLLRRRRRIRRSLFRVINQYWHQPECLVPWGTPLVIETTVYARLAPSSMYDGNEHTNEPRTETRRRRARVRVLSPLLRRRRRNRRSQHLSWLGYRIQTQ
jgi:hypothetical protein